ncbi:MAG: outer membrane lipoprotein-sorting protein [Acidobacteriaceae bacterium]|nr:outer membrane lipoprotein-sorting protein [Acidobacteriaceae bacterium]
MKTLLLAVCLFAYTSELSADTVESILARMDAAAPAFHALTANTRMDTFESILNDHTIENGQLQMQRNGKDVRAIIAFTGANDARTISFQSKTILIYYPKLNAYTKVDVGNKGQLVNQLLLLGFGSSGKELSASYDIKLVGQDSVGGDPTTRLQLTPKDTQVLQTVSKVEIWIPSDAAYPVKQEFYQPNGNTQTATYTDIVLNPPMKGNLEFKLPRNAKPANK